MATLSLTFMTRLVVMTSQSTRRFQLVLVFFSPCSLLREYSETRYTCRDTTIGLCFVSTVCFCSMT